MSLITLVLVLVVIGFCLGVLRTDIPMNPTVQKLISAIVAFAVVLWVLDATGIYSQHWFRLR